jgi:hypothetical protein
LLATHFHYLLEILPYISGLVCLLAAGGNIKGYAPYIVVRRVGRYI